MYGTNIITLAFVGHLGDLELAAISIAITVVIGFNLGFLLGMGSALETLCGQAFGAKQYHMMGIYLQRSCIVTFVVAVLLVPTYIFTSPILKLMGQSDDIAELSGAVSIWLIPQQFAFVFMFPFQRYLQSQWKNMVTAWIAAVTLVLHIVLSWLVIVKFDMGLIGAAMTLNLSTWLLPIAEFLYIAFGGCPQTWTGLSRHAFDDLWPFIKLSVASGVMLCLEVWYYRILVLLTGHLRDLEVAVDSLSICMNVNSWEVMIPLGFLAATSVRVANELGIGNGKAAKFAMIVSATTSTAIGVVLMVLILVFRQEFALAFTSSAIIKEAVSKLAILLAFTILLNSVQPVLSGVAIGAGWQAYVAWINIGCYYVIGVPLGMLLGWVFNLSVQGIWTGMICGTAVQTLTLAYITYRCDWEGEVTKAIDRLSTWSSGDPAQITSEEVATCI
jgi:MATE family multidrug resistance protein